MIEECQSLIKQITDYATTSNDRSYAEARLNQIMTLTPFWQNNLTCLQNVDDTLLFFMCQGLQKYIWKHWFEFPGNEQEVISNIIMSTLFQRSTTLSNYARSKLEQLLGTVCTLSTSLDPVLKIASVTSNPNETDNLIVGVSALKTILDDVLTPNPRIPPEKLKQLLQIAESNSVAITQLAYQSTLLGINQGGGENPLLYYSLELIKTVLSKLPVGAHISMDLLILLFNIAENMFQSSPRVAIVAIESLSELMGKSYLPPNVGSSNILNELVVKAVALLRFVKVSCQDGLNDNPVIFALLEFLYMFTESHLERYLQSASNSNNINSFLAEIATVSCAVSDPNTLKKIILVWESIMGIELVWPLVSSLSTSAILPVVNQLLFQCLFSKNALLLESQQDIEDGLQIEPFIDPHIREIVSHLEIYYTGSKGNLDSPIENSALEGVQEITSVTVAIRQGATKLIQQFVAYSCGELTSFLGSVLPPMTQEFLLGMSSNSGEMAINFALDLYFILPLLPLCVEHNMLSCHLSNMILQLVTERVQTKGTAYVSVVVCTCHIMESLIKSMANGGGVNDSLTQCMNNIIQSCIIASDTTISPYPISITGSLFSLLLQSLMSLFKFLRINNEISPFAKVISEQLYVSVLPKLNVLPIEIQALLLCIFDLLVPNDISVKYIEQFRDLATLCYSSCDISCITDNSQIFLISRLAASVDAFAKFHSISDSAERMRVINILSPLQDFLSPILKSLLRSIESSTAVGNISSKGSLLVATRFIISLSCALLQCLGKKTFGTQANEILELCVSFFDNSSGSSIGIRMLQDGVGFPLIKQIFALVSVIATTSGATSTSAALQVHLSHSLINSISMTLSDQRICSELLQDLLKAGSIITKTYWYNMASNSGHTYSLQPTIELLVQLCVGCMDSSVSPQDALIAIEGVLALSKQHSLFTLPWFQQGSSWGALIRSCLKAIMLKTHAIHADAIFMLLSDLSQAKISSDTTNNFWSYLGNELLNLSSELQCGEFANALMQTLAKEVELDSRKIIDISMFQQKILLPISCEIARLRE